MRGADGPAIVHQNDADTWHAMSVPAVIEALDTGMDGLVPEEAEARLARHGPNVIEGRARPTALRLLLRQFTSVLVWVLVVAAAISGVVLGDVVEAIVILVIVVINAVIGFVQEWRAEDAMEALQRLSAPMVRVVRGDVVQIPAADLVPGDVVVLETGDRIAADGRLVESVGLSIDESTLTGESLPVEKSTESVDPIAAIGDRRGMVFGGTTVQAGRGRVVVVATGSQTEMGRIAGMLTEEEPPTPLQRELAAIGRRVTMLAGAAAVVVFGVGLASGGAIESLFLVAVALAVAAIPEGLPAVTTITLARGVRTMAERKAIVRSLPAVEALGAAQVICTDKTGTLTKNRMSVQDVAVADEAVEPRLRRAVALCSDVQLTSNGLVGDPTETALVEWAGDGIVGHRRENPRVAEVGFDADRKRMVTVHRNDRDFLVVAKGAPEKLVPLVDRIAGADGDRPLDGHERQALLEGVERLASSGLRTIAIAERRMESLDHTGAAELESGLTWLGVVGMADELRPEAAFAIETCKRAGIEVVMLTGDHLVTARSIADQVGLLDGRKVIDHQGLAEIDDEALTERIEEIGAFARVEPADKVRIVKAWQASGRIVSMTGDGVNDAPALRMADIGVAMGSGTDVAKDASDVVLADDNFATIVAAVERGRAIFANLRKVTYFLLAANLSEIIVMVAGFLLFASYGEPLVAVQLLWVNLVTDGMPALALGMDPPARDIMRRPPDSDRNILGLAHQARLVWQGAVLAAGPLALFAVGVAWDLDWDQTRSMAFSGLVITQLVHAMTVRAQTHSIFRTAADNAWLIWSLVLSLVVHLVVIGTPLGSRFLHTASFPAEGWIAVALAAVVPALIIDAIKVEVRRRRPNAVAAVD